MVPAIDKIYWIDPNKIEFHTKFRPNEYFKIEDHVFGKNYRGKILSGDWDLSDSKFSEIDAFKAIKARIINHVNWRDTDYYKYLLSEITSGTILYGCRNESELIERFDFWDYLINNIKKNGYIPNINFNKYCDEIAVNIGRNGEFLFQDGRHRLSIAILLGVPLVPINVFVRHKKWVHIKSLYSNLAAQNGGKLSQPIFHPDLLSFPFENDCIDIYNAINSSLPIKTGSLFEVNARFYYYCHKFEMLGYNCKGIECNFNYVKLSRIIKKFNNKRFEIIHGDLFDCLNKKCLSGPFDIVLILNDITSILKNKESIKLLITWLEKVKYKFLFLKLEQINDLGNNLTNLNKGNVFLNNFLKEIKLKDRKQIFKTNEGIVIYKLISVRA